LQEELNSPASTIRPTAPINYLLHDRTQVWANKSLVGGAVDYRPANGDAYVTSAGVMRREGGNSGSVIHLFRAHHYVITPTTATRPGTPSIKGYASIRNGGVTWYFESSEAKVGVLVAPLAVMDIDVVAGFSP